MIKYTCSLLLVLIGGALCSQDTLRHPSISPVPAYALSGGLIVGGLILDLGDTKRDVRDWVIDNLGTTTNDMDDILQHAPIAMMYLHDLAHSESATEVGRQTRHMITTQALTIGGSLLLKEIINNKRPSGGSYAFPSGHTAYSFAGATVLYHTLKEERPFWAWSGYLPAVTVGAFRILKDRHWVSDVVFGAGYGILCAHLTYDLNIWDSANNRQLDEGHLSHLKLTTTANGYGLVYTF